MDSIDTRTLGRAASPAALDERSVKRLAGLSGLLYLLLAVFTGYPGVVGPALRVAGDAAATARNLVASAGTVTIATFSTLVGGVAWVLLALALYALLRDVNRDAALSLLVFTALGTGLMMLDSVLLLEGMRVATGAVDLGALGAAGSEAVAALLLDLHVYAGAVAAVFMGLWLIPMGMLAARSDGLLPRWLGAPLVVGGVGYLLKVTATFLAPGIAQAVQSWILWPATLAEIATIVALFAVAVRWRGRRAGDVPMRAGSSGVV